MELPNDFDQTLTQVQESGVLAEDAESVRQLLLLELNRVALKEGARATDMGIADWASKLTKAFEAAVYQEICDSEKGALKKEYQDTLNNALSPQGVAATGAIVMKVLAVVNPAFAISSVAIYLSTWLLKIGLNHWCSIPPK